MNDYCMNCGGNVTRAQAVAAPSAALCTPCFGYVYSIPEGYRVEQGITHASGKHAGKTALIVYGSGSDALGVAFTPVGARRLIARHQRAGAA